MKSVHYWPKQIWSRTVAGKQQDKEIKLLLDFTKKVIHERRDRWNALKKEHGDNFNEFMFGDKNVRKNRIAFLGK